MENLNGYISAADYAKKVGVSANRVRVLCVMGRIPGAIRVNIGKGFYIIPKDAMHERRGPGGRPLKQKDDSNALV